LNHVGLKLTIIGGCGAWPEAGRACSGYLLEHEGFRLLIDPGYSTFSLLSKRIQPEQINAVLVTHGHPDHCADLNPLLRARAMGGSKPAALPTYAPAGALERVLALDKPRMLREAYEVSVLPVDGFLRIGPLRVETCELPHFVPNLGVRLTIDGRVFAYTGDTAPSPAISKLFRGADLALAEATFPDEVPGDLARGLCSARLAGEYATEASVGELLLTHLWPGTERGKSQRAASRSFQGRIQVAKPGLSVDV
jgi:ribonuclease BN (tRNA processing enzyme)